MNVEYKWEEVDLEQFPALLEVLLARQTEAIRAIGASDQVILPEDRIVSAGTWAIVVHDSQEKLIGGARLHSRTVAQLPIEGRYSPLPSRYREMLSQMAGLTEIRGLWSCPAAGRWLGRKLVARALDMARKRGATGVVSFTHYRCFQLVAAAEGFLIDDRVPPMPYPDDRFLSLLIRHDLKESARANCLPQEVLSHG